MSSRQYLSRKWRGAVSLSCRWGLVVAVSLSLGAHWAFLQAVAWTGMIVSYSREASFTEALSKTFDGRHPCRMCRMIQKGRADEKKQEGQQTKPGSKQEPGLAWKSFDFDFSRETERVAASDARAEARREEPPKPRPRKRVFNFV
jgi:hypothetical protein